MDRDSVPGIFGKVVARGRGAAAARGAAAVDGETSKQALRAMLERKRRNDYVRRREFDYLRMLRSKGADGTPVSRLDPVSTHGMETGGRNSHPSQSRMGSSSSRRHVEDRAVTLKKIDEIEAQMSMQWWKNNPAARGPAARYDAASTRPLGSIGQLQSPLPAAPASAPIPAASSEFSEDGLVTLPMVYPAAFMASNAVAEEAFAHEPTLEKAAVDFANGAMEDAEAALLDVLHARRGGAAEDACGDIWLALFDFYRVTGNQGGFEEKAIEYAQQTGRSAPVWFSLPELLGMSDASGKSGAEEAASGQLNWRAPSILKLASIESLRKLMEKSAQPWTLNWSQLTAIEVEAVPVLTEFFRALADNPDAHLQFVGLDELIGLLDAHTPMGDASVDQAWWFLGLEVLRLTARAEAFDLAALDYCVTYEVSPPAWTEPAAQFTALQEEDFPQAADQAVEPPGKPQGSSPPAAAHAVSSAATSAVLSGVILENATPILDKYEALVRPGQMLVVQCNHLMRIDFAAAGTVLNWTVAQHAVGVQIHFRNLNRLVATLFNVLGINGHATVSVRQN